MKDAAVVLHRVLGFLVLAVGLSVSGCPSPCPDGFLRDNDGNCIQVGDDDDAGDDDAGDDDAGDDDAGDDDAGDDDAGDDDAGDDDAGDDDAGDDDASGCAADEVEDCQGNCAPWDWVGDGSCDDGIRDWPNASGTWIDLDCAEHHADGGDCGGSDDDDVAPDDDDAGDDDDADDDDDATPALACFDQPLTCVSGAPLGTPDSFAALTTQVPMVLDPVSGWACSDPISFEIASDTTGFYVAAVGGAVISDLEAPSGTVVDLPLPDVSGMADADVLVELLTAMSALSNAATDPPANVAYSGVPALRAAFQFPTTPSSVPQAGCHALRVVAPPAVAGSNHPVLLGIRRGANPGQRLGLHVVHHASLPEAQVLEALVTVDSVLVPSGLQLGEVTLELLDPALASVDIAVGGQYNVFGSASSTGADVVLYLVEELTHGTDPFNGISSGIPGDLGQQVDPFTGVIVSTYGGTRLGFDMGQTIAHEIGHQLGLRHTTERYVDSAGNWTHDLLPDTPECTNGVANPDPSGPAWMITPASCVGSGTENVMFPLADATAVGLTPQQVDVFSSIGPEPQLSCADHADCDDYEICFDGICEYAYGRPYTVYLDSVSVTGSWDFGSAPDPYADWWVGLDSGTTVTLVDTAAGYWFEEANGVWVFPSLTSLQVTVMDEDPGPDDEIDDYVIGPPIPVDYLRIDWELFVSGANSTIGLGFAAE